MIGLIFCACGRKTLRGCGGELVYQALYRKWRPQTFDDVVGQQHITETLKNQVRTNRLSHAYLFIGTRGTGKTTCAKILAKAVNCEHPVDGNPCNCCPTCRGIDDGSILDVVEMDAASNNKVEDVRLLRDEAVYSPANAKKRVYIVDEVHMLSNSAFNALLKILEEPPEHLMFILATTELHKVPATILSRCQRHSFKRIAAEDIAGRLQYVAAQEQIGLQPEAAMLLARLAEGGMRDALTLLDQCSGDGNVTAESVRQAIGLAGHAQTAELAKWLAKGDTAGALQQFRDLWQEGKDPASLLDELSVLLRDVLMRSVAKKGSSALLSGGYEDALLDAFAKVLNPAQLMRWLTTIQEALSGLSQSVNPKLGAELCLIRLSTPEVSEDLAGLAARVSALEQGAVPVQRKEIQLPEPEPMPEPAEKPEPIPEPEDTPPWEPEPVKAPEPEIVPPREMTPPPPTEDAPPWEPPVEEAPPLWEPEPIPEPAPMPEPEPVPMPEPVPEPPAAAGSDWEKILQAAQKLLPMAQFSVLKNPDQVQGHLEGDTLILDLDPGFAFMMLGTPAMEEKLRTAAQQALGKAVHVQSRKATKKGGSNQRSLEELTRFDIVSFE